MDAMYLSPHWTGPPLPCGWISTAGGGDYLSVTSRYPVGGVGYLVVASQQWWLLVSILCSLASHNVGLGWDKLNSDDPEEDGSEGGDILPKGGSVLQVFRRHQNDLIRDGPPSSPFSVVGVVTGSYDVLEMVSFLHHLWCTFIRESPEVKRVSSFGHEW
ncbi:hypothetical protein TIFTF001_033004 [Ficus carica]|uniref:Uncharacterized protein n=1 Tax=Ficus carica TaxID=3494 RepID=A0AA88DXR0_FICCA|nr:hypothetical protein TIFTF001_033004 [Ficus carica]